MRNEDRLWIHRTDDVSVRNECDNLTPSLKDCSLSEPTPALYFYVHITANRRDQPCSIFLSVPHTTGTLLKCTVFLIVPT